jgi:hypothetical protein
MCRYILGVHPKTTIAAIRGDVGRMPLYTNIIPSVLKYFHALNSDECSDLLKDSLLCSQELALTGQSWYNGVTFLCKQLGIQMHTLKGPVNSWLPTLKRSLYDKFVSGWKRSILHVHSKNVDRGNKLRTYQKFKTNFGREAYIDIISNQKARKAMARFRTSAHKLYIETGRYAKPRLKPEQRICRLCSSSKVEDEIHFLTECQVFEKERQNLFNAVTLTNKHFWATSGESKLIWLMSNEDTPIVRATANFLHTCFEKRDKLLASQTVNG